MTEASVDAIHEIAEAFAARIAAGEVANEVYSEHKTGYVHLFVGGYPADGFDEDHARARIAELAGEITPLGWFVAKIQFDEYEAEDRDEFPDEEPQLMCFVDLFPIEGTRIRLPYHQGPTSVWHVSPRAARDGIVERGLEPSTGGSDFIVTAQGRIYVVIDEDDVEHFVADMRRLRKGWDEYDLWRIDLSQVPDHVWRDDVEAPDMGAWTDAAIPSTAITLIDA